MKLYRIATRAGFIALIFYAAVVEIFTEIFKPSATARTDSTVSKPWKLIVKTVIATAILGLILEGVGGVLFAMSGLYNIAADQPHFIVVAWLLKTFSSQSARFHTEPERVPNLRDGSLIKQGFLLCRKNCQPCHGAPGVPNDASGRGINPKPPTLVDLGNKWNDTQLFWIISHGLKMSGMPGFDERLSDGDRWATVAFLRRVVLLTPTDYERLTRAADAGTDDPGVPWVANTDLGFQQIQSHGNAARGKDLLSFYGCNSCHTIPGVGAGAVGPPLADFAERQYVAGLLVNTPRNVETWIRNPKSIKPITAMPNLNVTATDAVDIAAYLYTQGSRDRVKVLKEAAGKGGGS